MYYEEETLSEQCGFFLKKCPALLLISIFKCEEKMVPAFKAKLIKMVDMTQSHATQIIKKFELFNFVETEKKGRTRLITLTEKGIEFAKILIEMDNFYLKG